MKKWKILNQIYINFLVYIEENNKINNKIKINISLKKFYKNPQKKLKNKKKKYNRIIIIINKINLMEWKLKKKIINKK